MANTSAVWQQAAHTAYQLWRSCARDNVDADESYSMSLPAQTMKVMVIV